MTYYPIYLNLQGRPILVVGAGPIGLQKVRGLLESGAQVVVVAMDAEPEIAQWAQEKRLTWRSRAYQTSDLDGVDLVFAATDDTELQQRLTREARQRRLWINVVDVPPLCDFIAPSIVRQGDLHIAISTGGAAPAFSKFIRRKLEPLFGAEYGELVRLAQQWRSEIAKLPKEERLSVWEQIASDSFLSQIKQKGSAHAELTLKEWIYGKRSV